MHEDKRDGRITQVETVVDQLSGNGVTLAKILRLLINNFENTECMIEKSKDLSVLSIEELLGSPKVQQ